MPDRYACREEPPSTWAVYDLFTGLPVIILGQPMVGMDIGEADAVAQLLNLQDAIRDAKEALAKPRH